MSLRFDINAERGRLNPRVYVSRNQRNDRLRVKVFQEASTVSRMCRECQQLNGAESRRMERSKQKSL